MSKATEPYVILTIDDEPLIRETFRFYLEDFGYRVLEAENGRVGLEVIEQHLPDLVLVDLRMPEVDGLDVLKVMKRTYPDIPVVVVSGTGFIGDAVEALRLGAWNYLLKPVEDLNMLIYAIEQSLDKARLIRENKEYRENLEEKVRLRTGELNRANDLLSQTRMQIVFRLGKTAEYRDKVTGRHVVRVSCYTRIIAQALGLDKDEADLVAMCSALHDVGKLGVPDYILNKPGRLDDEEWAIMKQHCRMGQEILSPLTIEDLAFMQKDNDECAELLSDSRLLKTARTIAYSHHERWDGKGYPEGLEGGDIPLHARIVAAVDVFDAISNERPYKKAYPDSECFQIMRESAGVILDPAVVDAFFSSLDSIREIGKKWSDV